MANARLGPDRLGSAVRVAAAREKARINPADVRCALAYGEALADAGMLAEAIAEFQRALRIDYTRADVRFALGSAWLDAGEPERALQEFEKLGETMPGLSEKIDAAESMIARPRFDERYVRHLFDQFSADYDERMIGKLGYHAPQVLRELADMVMPGRKGLAVLDLGCGTGLSGAAFKDIAGRLDGVDLSPGMIEKARARRIYDSLSVADIDTCLTASGRQYDLVLAADTLIYLGDLSALLAGVASVLCPDGYFLVTVEKKIGEGFELGPKRRWRHSESYLRNLADRNEFEVVGLIACTLRSEAGVPVEGLAVALSRPA
jgi:predicted TPR repeat methyltransferase